MKRLLFGLLSVAALSGCNEEDPLFRMFRQKKVRPYSETRVFKDGHGMRQLVEGTVPREKRLDLDKGMPQVTLALLEKGQRRYDIVCGTCHGLTGESDWQPKGIKSTGSIVATNFVLNPAPSWHQDRLRQKPDQYFYDAISKGFGYMPAFTEIPQEERWAIVAYVRALQLSERFPAEKLSEAEKAELAKSAAASTEPAQHKEHP